MTYDPPLSAKQALERQVEAAAAAQRPAVKPLGRKNYGSIPHLPNSRMGPADHSCHPGQARIVTEKLRSRRDEVYVTEKLDGSNCGVARIGDDLYPISRAGYPALTSPYVQHHLFHAWVMEQRDRFLAVLRPGERLVGEWMAQAHGTRYDLPHEPFVAFDLMDGEKRLPYDQFRERIEVGHFVPAHLLHWGGPLSVEAALVMLCQNEDGTYGYHGAKEPVEGAVWRVEHDKPTGRKGETVRVVDFLVKYVRPDKVDGCYLPNVSGREEVWNWLP